MRRGLTLIELLVVTTVLPFVTIVISGIFATFIRDIPRDTRLLQQNTTVLDMTRRLAADMDRAEGLPDSVDALHNDERTLLIELPDQVVCYQLQDGAVTRTVRRQGSRENSNVVRTWRFRDAVVAWQCRRQGERAYAVELRTHFQQRVAGRLMDKLVNSHVYFVNAFGKAREVE